ncbi:MAG: glycosyl transferase [Acidobacteriota bacterium]
MTDFYQHGSIATLHRLSTPDLDALEQSLSRYTRRRPIALVIPALYSDLVAAPMREILKTLRDVPYLQMLVVSLDQADEEHFRLTREILIDLPFDVRVVWNHGPRVQGCLKELSDNKLYAGEPGKGRASWMAFGYVLANEEICTIALHDSDIRTYSREFLARLCYPVANPHFDFEFCKGFYARYADRMYGRVTRLLIFPLLRSLREIMHYPVYLNYLSSFRYPLAGEIAMAVDLARSIRIPGDWGLEVGMLGEVYRTLAIKRVCQSELCERYDHKHQDLSPEDPDAGLHRMSVDIMKNLLRTMAAEGITIDEGLLQTVVAMYVKRAEDTVNSYAADAVINGLEFDRHAEETAVHTFAESIQRAGELFFDDPLGVPLIPNWNRITSALPDFLGRLRAAVEEDQLELVAATAGSVSE